MAWAWRAARPQPSAHCLNGRRPSVPARRGGLALCPAAGPMKARRGIAIRAAPAATAQTRALAGLSLSVPARAGDPTSGSCPARLPTAGPCPPAGPFSYFFPSVSPGSPGRWTARPRRRWAGRPRVRPGGPGPAIFASLFPSSVSLLLRQSSSPGPRRRSVPVDQAACVRATPLPTALRIAVGTRTGTQPLTLIRLPPYPGTGRVPRQGLAGPLGARQTRGETRRRERPTRGQKEPPALQTLLKKTSRG